MMRTLDPRYHPRVMTLAPVTVSIVAALIAAFGKRPISGY